MSELRSRRDVKSLLQALREHADQTASQARFKDIGIVQRIGDGVATPYRVCPTPVQRDW